MKLKSGFLILSAIIFIFIFNNVDVFAAKAEKEMDLINYQSTPNPIFKLQAEPTPTVTSKITPVPHASASSSSSPTISPSVSPATPKPSPSMMISPLLSPIPSPSPSPSVSATLTPQALISGN